MAFIGVGLGAARTALPGVARVCGRSLSTSTKMALTAGAKLPLDRELMEIRDGKPATVPLRDVFAGKKVVMFSIPGALTPTCTDSHAPEYVAAAQQLADKGVDGVVCIAVNDPFVMDVYRKKVDAQGTVRFLADGDAGLTSALGIQLDTGAFGGVRAVRGSYVVEDGVFTQVNLESGGGFEGPAKVATVLAQL